MQNPGLFKLETSDHLNSISVAAQCKILEATEILVESVFWKRQTEIFEFSVAKEFECALSHAAKILEFVWKIQLKAYLFATFETCNKAGQLHLFAMWRNILELAILTNSNRLYLPEFYD